MTKIVTTVKLNNYLGAIHIHSKFSDGTGDVKTICRAAKAAGLDWIIITDHNNSDIQEGFIEGICVIKGEEISPDNNHYLAFGINKIISPSLSPKEFVDEVRVQGGFGIVAHPDESDFRKNNNRAIKWLDKTIEPDGIEIWNWFSTWGDNYSDKHLFELAYAYLFKHRLITAPKEETLSWWDELNNNSEKIVPAIGGLDAHALKINDYILPVTIFPYKEMFKTITNVISLNTSLSEDFSTAKNQILSAIKEGKNLIVNRHLCSEIPEINIENINKKVGIGEEISCDNNTYINIKLGKKFNINLICDGKMIWNKFTNLAKIPLCKKGKYRVEIGLNKLGYAYSNPIILN